MLQHYGTFLWKKPTNLCLNMKAKASTYFTCLLSVHRFVYFYFNFKNEDFLLYFVLLLKFEFSIRVFTMLLNLGEDDAYQHESRELVMESRKKRTGSLFYFHSSLHSQRKKLFGPVEMENEALLSTSFLIFLIHILILPSKHFYISFFIEWCTTLCM